MVVNGKASKGGMQHGSSVKQVTVTEISTKKCNGCNQIKLVSEFQVKRKKAAGLSRWDGICKACDSKSRKKKYRRKVKKQQKKRRTDRVIDIESLEFSELPPDDSSLGLDLNDLMRHFIFDLICDASN